jgi:2-polyprenyl-3-methyl-5-hydroxy-6-metoxy-1,4-benzoquinol methylase
VEKNAIEAMIAAEEIHPWYRSRLLFVNQVLRELDPKTTNILDFGCGSGAALQVCKNNGFDRIFGVDASELCIDSTRSRGIPAEKITSILPTLESKYDLIICLDVLEHLENDVQYLKLFKDHLTNQGKILVSVPAHQFLWSKHDEINHHFRRYSKKSLFRSVSAAQLQIHSFRYWNSMLFPIFVVRRSMQSFSRKAEHNEFAPPNYLIRELLFTILKFETKHKFFGYLTGVSVIAILELPRQ